MKAWEIMARNVEETYGGFVDWSECFFECPECGEPIYESDWSADELGNGYVCPVCGGGIE